MRDYERALADISDIRSRMAAGTVFRGLGPAALAGTGLLAIATAIAQDALLPVPAEHPALFFAVWIAIAVVCVALVGAEMVVRSRRHHAGMADAMVYQAVHQFLPAGAAGAAIALVLGRFAPAQVWMLPGLWQVLVSLGLFAAVPSLPRGALVAAAWYFLAGCTVLMLSAPLQSLSPWHMGLPFAIGQLLLAAVIARAPGGLDAR